MGEAAADGEALTYDAFGSAVREPGQTIADDGFEPDLVLAPAPSAMMTR